MKRKTSKKKQVELEKVVFAVILWTLGVLVMSLFSMTLFQGPAGAVLGTSLETSIVQNSPSAASGSNDMAKNLIVAGALGFCVLGFAIFLGLKIKDYFF